MIRLKTLLEQSSNTNVTIRGEQPYPGTDWDMVHGYFGSKRLTDDLEERVSAKLKSGNWRVTYVEINSAMNDQNDGVVTNGYVRLEPAGNKPPHKVFTTRGSIGANYASRHDSQVSGLQSRLKDYYKGEVTVFGPYDVTITTPDNNKIAYRQSFFAVEQNTAQQGTSTNSIRFTDAADARNKLKSLPKDKWSKATITGNQITLQLGASKALGLSGIYDPSRDVLQTRLNKLKSDYGYATISDLVRAGNLWLAVITTE